MFHFGANKSNADCKSKHMKQSYTSIISFKLHVFILQTWYFSPNGNESYL